MFLLSFVYAAIAAALVPGSTNPAVTQENIQQTICVAGWSQTIRPPRLYTYKLKVKQMAAYHLPGKTADYEEDHLISLELGGNPLDPNNLWPQKWNGFRGAHKKDQLENRLHTLVCSGQITLRVAQVAIATDWVSAWKKYVVHK